MIVVLRHDKHVIVITLSRYQVTNEAQKVTDQKKGQKINTNQIRSNLLPFGVWEIASKAMLQPRWVSGIREWNGPHDYDLYSWEAEWELLSLEL